ncbi:hypothetical protein LOC71_06810 [Rhodopirellula sp. JC740]|uniref:histidine kinase n=1 Tax=Rhodopirellula halodulae TaxID=2894198 RepID=A0ABS8NEY1_9BACT|nr:ATP-binding protein [Rhodopirellula sp. JC740]MCC9641979.1 hypothetical protein [Rhodopirellula sp. JC740]
MHVLIVDPDSQLRDVWADRIATESIRVSTSGSEQETQSAISKEPLSAAFVRFPLTYSDSPEAFLDLLRTHCHYLVALTNDDSSVMEDAYEQGFLDCILDPRQDSAIQANIMLAERLNRLEQRLAQAQKLESIGELAAGIAHEINTPIQYVGDNTRFVQDSCVDLIDALSRCSELAHNAGSADVASEIRVLLEETDIDYLMEEVPSAIRQTLEGVDRVANIVRAMKEFAHPGVSEMVPTDLPKSIENTLMVARNEWKYVAELETEFDPEVPLVPCLPGELNQVLLNMVVNAAHAIGDTIRDRPGEKGTIKVSTHLRGTHAEIRIADSGTGIPAEDVEKVFAPFYTTKAAGKGTGQGLAIAQTVIVENHGGRIEVESEVGVGTTFIIQVPLEARREGSTFAAPSMPTAPVCVVHAPQSPIHTEV